MVAGPSLAVRALPDVMASRAHVHTGAAAYGPAPGARLCGGGLCDLPT